MNMLRHMIHRTKGNIWLRYNTKSLIGDNAARAQLACFWLRYVSLKNTLIYNFANLQENPLTFVIQNVCLKWPCFGEIQYGEKGQNM